MTTPEINQARRLQKRIATMTVEDFMSFILVKGQTFEDAKTKINEAKAFVASLPHDPLQEEIDARIIEGSGEQITLRDLTERLKAIGYRLDRSMDCRSTARYMTGPRAGKSHPCVSLYPRQIDDGKSAWHFEARRDDNFKQLQKIRSQMFFVSKGAIHEI